MRKLASLAVIALAAMGSGHAVAADLPAYKDPPIIAPPPPLWTGFYAGVNIGGGWHERNFDDSALWLWSAANDGGPVPWMKWKKGHPPVPPPFTPGVPFLAFANANNSGSSGGVVGGGQIGYNYQFGTSFLVGVETDFQGTSIGSGGGAQLPWFGTVRGRVGYLVIPTLLLYGTGGFAYGEVQTRGFWNSFSSVGTGWTAGGGGEWLLMPNWSVKVEYLYSELSGFNRDNWGWGGFDGARRDYRFHTVRAGLNWHINFLGAPALGPF